MTGIHYCKNCKYLRLDGMFGLICDVNGNNKNYDCPKYEEKCERMTEKRYFYDPKQVAILKDGEFWLEGQIDTACNHSEICNELNQLAEENEQLKSEIEKLSYANEDLLTQKRNWEKLSDEYAKVYEENEQLQSEVNKLTDLLASEIEKNARLLQEINSLKIENMRLKESIKDLNDVLARYEEKELKE